MTGRLMYNFAAMLCIFYLPNTSINKPKYTPYDQDLFVNNYRFHMFHLVFHTYNANLYEMMCIWRGMIEVF